MPGAAQRCQASVALLLYVWFTFMSTVCSLCYFSFFPIVTEVNFALEEIRRWCRGPHERRLCSRASVLDLLPDLGLE